MPILSAKIINKNLLNEINTTIINKTKFTNYFIKNMTKLKKLFKNKAQFHNLYQILINNLRNKYYIISFFINLVISFWHIFSYTFYCLLFKFVSNIFYFSKSFETFDKSNLLTCFFTISSYSPLN